MPRDRLFSGLNKQQMYGFDFDRQRPLDRYIVDFYCKRLMLAIEVDGSSHFKRGAMAIAELRWKRLLGLQMKRLIKSMSVNVG
jgi:very-short-patch-repair endonuclease